MPPRMRRRITSAKREEFEKQQEELSRVIVRPFEVLSGLPVTFSQPPTGNYDSILKNPLTIKDSGIFYRSLMKSRYSYVHICPMFKLYWIKQSSYAKKLAEQDKPLPKSAKDETLSSRTPVLSSDVSARDVMVKLCDASLSLGPHNFEIRLFIAKDERSDKPSKKKDKDSNVPVLGIKKPDDVTKVVEVPIETSKQIPRDDENKVSENEKKSDSENVDNLKNDEKSVKESNNQKIQLQEQEKSTQDILSERPHTDMKESEAKSETKNKEPFNKINSKPEIESSESRSSPAPTGDQNPPPLEDKRIANVPNPSQAGVAEPVQLNQQKPTGTPAEANNMQSIENTIMISNLNMIAKTDQSLNALMKIVASGNASPQEIVKFQGYIKRAREMGPQPHHAYLFSQQPYYPYSQKGGLLDKSKKMLKERKLPKDKKPPKLKSKIPKDQKLTAFQEKYLSDATILFEYVENSNIRFMFPKYGICEVLKPEVEVNEIQDNEESDQKDILISFLWIHNQNEVDEYEKNLANYEKLMKEKEEEEKEAERKNTDMKDSNDGESIIKEDTSAEAINENSNEIKPTDALQSHTEIAADDDKATECAKEIKPEVSTRRVPPVRKGRKKRYTTTHKKVPVKKLERPTEPEFKYTALSFTIRGIPSRYVPIITNSFKPLEEVQERMQYILVNGTRMSNFYLWYQVDGKLDEALAEEVRIQLNQEEKKLPGVVSTSSINSKKRPKKEKVEPKPKRKKNEDGIKENKEVSEVPREISLDPVLDIQGTEPIAQGLNNHNKEDPDPHPSVIKSESFMHTDTTINPT